MGADTSLSQTGFHVLSGRSPDFENEKYVVWAGASLLPNCPASLISEFQSTGDESLIVLPCGGNASTSCLKL